MGEILGLDLGTASIGWALIDEENSKIINTGVRIFPEGAEDIGKKTEKSKNAERREKRQARRQTYRRKLRRIKLLEALIENNMCPLTIEELKKWKNYKKGQSKEFPQNLDFTNWIKMNPYTLRDKGVKEELSLHEFGRILYHIIHHRGFKTGRKSTEETMKTLYSGKDETKGISDTKAFLDKDKTLGSYLNAVLNKGEERARSRYTLRTWYVDEFEKIWKKQTEFHNLDEKFVKVSKKIRVGSGNSSRTRKKIEYLEKSGYACELQNDGMISFTRKLPLKEYLGDKDTGILFYQKPLKSQKHLLAHCRFEPSKTPVPVSHPEFEHFRALQLINTIEYGERNSLNEEQRQKVLDLINSKSAAFDFVKVKEKLELEYYDFNYQNDFKVSGNYTISKLKNLFPEQVWSDPVKKDEIWHLFYTYNDNSMLVAKLKKDYDLLSGKEDAVGKLRLKDGYSNISLKAIKNIIPFLEKGQHYSEASLKGGVKNVLKDKWDNSIEAVINTILNEKNKTGESIEKIKEHLRNCYDVDEKDLKKLYHHSQEVSKKEILPQLPPLPNLRNPIVQTCLQELRRLVNSLSKEYLSPEQSFEKIRVEMARELKMPRKIRENISNENAARERSNNEARAVLDEYGLAHTRNNIQKYLLYKEIEDKNGTVVCPYTNKSIGITELLGSDNKFQIEHIIPFSVSLDDSFANKTLCESNENRNKGERTPYQFYGHDKKKWEDVKTRAFQLLPYEKAKRFCSTKDFELTDFINRQLSDTRYISKAARDYLSNICDAVYVTQGTLTADLRHKWGLNSILAPPLSVNTITPEGQYWAKEGESGKAENLQLIFNKRPEPKEDEFIVKGEIKKEKFKSDLLNENYSFSIEDQRDGNCWARVGINNTILSITPVFSILPQVSERSFWLRGKINRIDEKKDAAAFETKLLPKAVNVKNNGFEKGRSYWLLFELECEPEYCDFNKAIKLKDNQASFVGKVNDGKMMLTIQRREYSWEVPLSNGRWKTVLTFNLRYRDSIQAASDKPVIDTNQIIVKGYIKGQYFSCGLNSEQQFSCQSAEDGQYWAVFELNGEISDVVYLENELVADDPKAYFQGQVRNDEELIKKFYPVKNRDDHRHHAVDALVVACSDVGKLQKLSRWNARKKEFSRKGSVPRPHFDAPWENFRKDAEDSINQILVSHRQTNKVLTPISKTILKNGIRYKSFGHAVNGQLHKETVYGKRVDPETREPGYHIRKDITTIKNNKHVEKIADAGIRNLIKNKLKEAGIDPIGKYDIPKDFFYKDDMPQLLLPKKDGVYTPIRKVRMIEDLGNAVQLKEGVQQYVNPRSNHHVVVYSDSNGEFQEEIVTFWQVVERVKFGKPIYSTPESGKEVVATLKINDMFILGLTDSEIEERLMNRKALSPFLYRVQKLSSMYYAFRLHTESTLKNEYPPYMQRIVSFKAWKELNPVKVKINSLGDIEPEGA